MSQQQPIKVLKIFKGSFACKIVFAAKHLYPGKVQSLFRLQSCPRRKSSISWNCSKTFSPAKLSQQQPINILKMFKNFFACKIVVAANQRYSEKFKDFPTAKLSQQQPINILKTFKNFFACKIVVAANQRYPGNIQKFFRLQKRLSRKPSVSWKHSNTFSAAKMSQQQPIKVLKIFKGSFACKIVFAAKHLYPGKVQRLFRLQSCPRRKSSISWNCSKTFSPAKLSQQQPISTLKIFKDFFACKIVLAANHRYPGNIQRLFRLQKCLCRKSSISRKYSKTFSPAKLSQPQNIYILEKFKDFFACKIVLAATHHNSENVQKLFSLQNCRSRKSAIS